MKRLAASFAIAGRDRGFDSAISRSVVTAAVREYREAMTRFSKMRNIDVWYARLDVSTIRKRLAAAASGKQLKRFEDSVGKVRTKDSLRALAKLCQTVDGELRIVGHPPFVTPIEDVLPGAEQDHLEDVARRMIRTYRRTLRTIAASCSRATATCTPLLRWSAWAASVARLDPALGRDDDDPLFLQFKEAQASVLEPFLGKSRFAQHGQRVVEGQRMMQSAPHILLGWERIVTIDGETRDFYIRQLWDSKGSAEVESMSGGAQTYGESAAGRSREPTQGRETGSRSRRISDVATPRPRDGVLRGVLRRPERWDYDALKQAAASGRVAAQLGLGTL